MNYHREPDPDSVSTPDDQRGEGPTVDYKTLPAAAREIVKAATIVAARPTLSGDTVRKIVARHVPEGWNWRQPFVPTTTEGAVPQ